MYCVTKLNFKIVSHQFFLENVTLLRPLGQMTVVVITITMNGIMVNSSFYLSILNENGFMNLQISGFLAFALSFTISSLCMTGYPKLSHHFWSFLSLWICCIHVTIDEPGAMNTGVKFSSPWITFLGLARMSCFVLFVYSFLSIPSSYLSFFYRFLFSYILTRHNPEIKFVDEYDNNHVSWYFFFFFCLDVWTTFSIACKNLSVQSFLQDRRT